MSEKNILHVVGYRNSGKTTLVSNWVRILKEAGYKVSVLKHHGHGAKLAMPDERKDSMQYLMAGADASIVSGGGYTQHISAREKSYEELISQMQSEKPDIILVEGYKQLAHPKVVMVSEPNDWLSLKILEGIQLVVGYQNKVDFPQIDSRTNKKALDQWIIDWANALKR